MTFLITLVLWITLFGYCYSGVVDITQVIDLSVDHVLSQKRLVSVGEENVSLAEVHFHFQSYADGATGDELLEVVAFHASHADTFLSCCNEQMVSEGHCTSSQIGTVAFVNESLVFKRSYNFSNGEYLTFSDSFLLDNSGYWYFYIVNCGSEEIQIINGNITWIDSVGYLLIENFPLLPTHIILGALLYLVALAWIIHLCIYSENIMGIQYFLFSLILIGAIEQTLESVDMLVYNAEGKTSGILFFAGVIFTSLKLSLTRLALMLIGLGISITKPGLPSSTYTYLAGITFVYGLIEGLNQYLLLGYYYGYLGLEGALYIFQILIVVINIIYFVWVFS
eukprot:TRINITY_DN4542_c0_g1_i2.p1 TRINITY_DN4542_c0_g1~~TRINITY_DN4542_c0_g1_i2.p1  ORF type:complete len:337 (+),score=43.57 TRINITY_DN4542_c0_g1_i2:1051-2061(+)